MAEALFKQILTNAELIHNWNVESAGTWAVAGSPATPYAREVMKERGLDIDSHRSKPVSSDLLQAFDLVLVMEKRHSDFIQNQYAGLADRVHMLSTTAGPALDVDDPVWGTIETYRETVDEMVDLMERGFERILELVNQGEPNT
jgi:protein-tyrosine-phosphatase